MKNYVAIIDNTQNARNKYKDMSGAFYGTSCVIITKEHISALLIGKQIAFDNGEYSCFLCMNENDDETITGGMANVTD